MPFEGDTFARYNSPAREKVHEAVNAWIRSSRMADAVIDFDTLMRDPNHPTRLNPKYDHPVALSDVVLC